MKDLSDQFHKTLSILVQIKHVEMERWAKRNIGSRRLITWIKYLRNCIPYHEVNLVKTAIEE